MTPISRSLITWRYLPRRGVKHAVWADGSYVGHSRTAVCGISPVWFAPSSELWWGTGKQSEYEEVERLPECRRCAGLLTTKETA